MSRLEKIAEGKATDESTLPSQPSRIDKIVANESRRNESPYDASRRQYAGIEEPSLLAKIGRGAVDVTDGIQQIYYDLTDPKKAREFQRAKDAELGIYEAGAGEGFDGGRLLGQIGGTAPAMLIPGANAGLLSRTLSGAAQGAAAGGLLYTKEDESRLGNAQAGLLGGAAAPLAIHGLGKAAGGIASAAKRAKGSLSAVVDKIGIQRHVAEALDDIGVNFAALGEGMRQKVMQEAQAQLRTNGVLNPEAIARKTMLEEMGFVGDAAPMIGQVTRNPTAWQTERNLAKLDEGYPIVGRLQHQDAQFARLKDKVIGDIPEVDRIEEGQLVIDAIKGRWKTRQDAVGALYKEVRDTVGDRPGIVVDNLLDKLDGESVNATASNIVNSVRGRLGQIGYDDAGNLTVSQAEELRKFIGGLADGNDPNLQRLKREFIDMLDDDVIDSTGQDSFKAARSAARQRFQEFSTKLVKSIVENKTEPQRIISAIRSASPQSLENLKFNLMDTPDGKVAWDRIKKQVITDLWDKAQPDGEVGEFVGSTFRKNMKAFENSRLKILFEPEELSQLTRTAEAGITMTRTPAYSAVNWSNTAPAAYNLLQKTGGIPVIGDMLQKAGETGMQRAAVQEALSGSTVNPAMLKAYSDQVSKGLLSHPVSRLLQKPAPAAMGLLAPNLFN